MRTRAGAILVAPGALALAGCPERKPVIALETGGDAQRGRAALERHGCTACHSIPGLPPGDPAAVGPPLDRMARQSYVAGVLPNVPEQLVRWIVEPERVDPRTAMPNLAVTEAEARDMAAYLYGVGQ